MKIEGRELRLHAERRDRTGRRDRIGERPVADLTLERSLQHEPQRQDRQEGHDGDLLQETVAPEHG